MGRVLGIRQLVAHPDTPPAAISRVTVQLASSGPRELWLEYHVATAATLLLPEPKSPARANQLWKTTCFELFIQPVGSEQYAEFNFSPSFEWAAYEFEGYRRGRQEMPSHDPEIAIASPEDRFFLAIEALPELPAVPVMLGLSAVIEEKDGTKSYWALAHPAAKPDFHHPDSFALQLPPE